MVREPVRLPKISGTQVGLRDPASIDQLKADMRAGRFAYHEERARITGLRDPKGVYYVMVGHHRVAAALEILSEAGDPEPLLQLLHWGTFHYVPSKPIDARPLPSRYWWGALRNLLGI